MQISVPSLIRAFQCTKNKVNKWSVDGYLSQRLPSVGHGRPAAISKKFATEIAFMAVLTKGGLHPTEAQHWAARWLERLRRGEVFDHPVGLRPMGGGEVRRFKSLSAALSHRAERVEYPLSLERRPAAMMIVINVPEILERLDYLADLYGRATSKDHPFDAVAERDTRIAINRGEDE